MTQVAWFQTTFPSSDYSDDILTLSSNASASAIEWADSGGTTGTMSFPSSGGVKADAGSVIDVYYNPTNAALIQKSEVWSISTTITTPSNYPVGYSASNQIADFEMWFGPFGFAQTLSASSGGTGSGDLTASLLGSSNVVYGTLPALGAVSLSPNTTYTLGLSVTFTGMTYVSSTNLLTLTATITQTVNGVTKSSGQLVMYTQLSPIGIAFNVVYMTVQAGVTTTNFTVMGPQALTGIQVFDIGTATVTPTFTAWWKNYKLTTES